MWPPKTTIPERRGNKDPGANKKHFQLPSRLQNFTSLEVRNKPLVHTYIISLIALTMTYDEKEVQIYHLITQITSCKSS